MTTTARHRWHSHAWSTLGTASYVYMLSTVDLFTWLGWLLLVAAFAQVAHLVDRFRSMRRQDHLVRRIAATVTVTGGAA